MKNCEICGSTNWAQTYKDKFLCRTHGYSYIKYGDPLVKINKEKVTARCGFCGKEYTVNNCYYYRSARHFCSQNCFGKGSRGEKSNSYRHGVSDSRIYGIWGNIVQRCTNKNNSKYNDYGGRGITVSEEWKNDFIVFNEWAINNGYSDKLEIDRIDNNDGYKPTNCRFVTRSENCRNTRSCVTNYDKKTRVCCLCKKELSYTMFVGRKKDPLGIRYECRKCDNKRQKEKRLALNKTKHQGNV